MQTSVASTSGLLPDFVHLSVTIDGTLSIEERVRRGHYHDPDRALQLIAERKFLVRPRLATTRAVQVHLIPAFREGIPHARQRGLMRRAGLVQADLGMLLALGEQHPDVLCAHILMAAGSSRTVAKNSGCTYMPVLWSRNGERRFAETWIHESGCMIGKEVYVVEGPLSP